MSEKLLKNYIIEVVAAGAAYAEKEKIKNKIQSYVENEVRLDMSRDEKLQKLRTEDDLRSWWKKFEDDVHNDKIRISEDIHAVEMAIMSLKMIKLDVWKQLITLRR